MTAGPTSIRVGRPRNPEADRAIITATLELLAEEGLSALCIEAVATRAGVGKATIYRRWSGKDELVGDALASLNDDLPPVPADLPVREALVVVLDHIRRRDPSTLSGRLMPRMLGYSHSQPHLFATYDARVLRPRRDRVRAVLAAAQARGEVGADVDLDLAQAMLVAPLLYQAALARGAGPLPAGTTEQLVDAVLAGLAPRT